MTSGLPWGRGTSADERVGRCARRAVFRQRRGVARGAPADERAASGLIGMFSPVPGGAGVREALMVAVAQASGIDGAAVLLAAIAYRVALFAAIPPLYLVARGWRALRRDD